MLEEYVQAYGCGWGDFTTGTVARLLGRSLRDHASAFAPAGESR